MQQVFIDIAVVRQAIAKENDFFNRLRMQTTRAEDKHTKQDKFFHNDLFREN